MGVIPKLLSLSKQGDQVTIGVPQRNSLIGVDGKIYYQEIKGVILKPHHKIRKRRGLREQQVGNEKER